MPQERNRQIGAVLVRMGVLSQQQVQAILDKQKQDHRPFGSLAQDLFDIPEERLWEAWAMQMISYCREVDLANEPYDLKMLHLLSAQEAWVNLVLPLRNEGSLLLCATTAHALPKAVAFVNCNLNVTVDFVLADPYQLKDFLRRRYEELQRKESAAAPSWSAESGDSASA